MSHPASSPLPSIWIARRREEASLSSPWLLLWPCLRRLLMSSPIVFFLSPLSLLSLLSIHDQKHQGRGETNNQQTLKHSIVHLPYPRVTAGHSIIIIKLFVISIFVV